MQHGTMIQDWAQIEALQNGQRVGVVVWDYERTHEHPIFEGVEPVEIMRWEDGTFLSLTTDHARAHYEESDWMHDRFEGDGHSLTLYLLDESTQPAQPGTTKKSKSDAKPKPTMTKEEARILALNRCASLIRVNIERGAGDLWLEQENAPDEDRERFAAACEQIAQSLWDRAASLEYKRDERKSTPKPRLKKGKWYGLRLKDEDFVRVTQIIEVTWLGPERGYWYGTEDDHRVRHGFAERTIESVEDA